MEQRTKSSVVEAGDFVGCQRGRMFAFLTKFKLDAIICSTIPRGAVKTAEMSDRSNPQT